MEAKSFLILILPKFCRWWKLFVIIKIGRKFNSKLRNEV